MVDRVGQQLGSYRLVRLLGRGGFAEVYLGEHVRLNNYAAVKVLNTSLGGSEAESFQREAHTIARLLHPHIIRVFDYDVAEGTPFLIMDYAPNGTLRNPHPKGTRMPLPTIVSYVKQVAGALQYAHGEKVIHRDIKPENMLLGRSNEVLLSDFGIATMSQSSRYPHTQDVVGTVAYMAPEQIQGKPHPASDQYSLAVVVYEWLSGERPFQGSFSEIAVQHVIVPPRPLREVVPTIAPEIEEVMRMALAKDPHQRFANVLAFANALEQASMPQAATGNAPTQISLSSAETMRSLTMEAMATRYPTTPVPEAAPSATTAADTNTPIPATIPFGNAAPPAQHKSIFSRRAVLLGIAALAMVGGSSAIFEIYYSSSILPKPASPSGSPQNQLTSTSVAQATSTPSPTATPTDTPTATPTQPPPFSGSWSALSALPYPTADNVAIYQQGYIYMTGGYRGRNYSPNNDDTLYRYNIAASQWETATSNFPGMYNSAVVQDEQQNLYFMGGYSPDNQVVTTLLYRYQPNTGTSQQISPNGQIVFGYGGSMLADQQGHLYLMQGFMQVFGTSSTAGTGWYRYNIAQNGWDVLASLPIGVAYAVLAFDSQGNIVLMGGVTDTEQSNGTNGIYRYNVGQNSWTQANSRTPQAFNGASSCAVGNGQVMVVGGYDPTNNVTLSNVWLIDPNTLNARPLASLPGGGSRLGTATCDGAGNVYITRGIVNDPNSPTADFLHLS